MICTGLLQALSHHNQEWLNTCKITKKGILKLSDRISNELSKPIKVLHQANPGSTEILTFGCSK